MIVICLPNYVINLLISTACQPIKGYFMPRGYGIAFIFTFV